MTPQAAGLPEVPLQAAGLPAVVTHQAAGLSAAVTLEMLTHEPAAVIEAGAGRPEASRRIAGWRKLT